GVTVEPQPNFALPSAAHGCGTATTLSDGASRIAITVSTVAGQTAETVNVCIDGHGPYPFVLDTGDSQSTIDAGLAHRLHLPATSASSVFAGVGCTGTARPVLAARWSVGGKDLTPQDLTSATLPQIGGKGEPDGLLGSDVLSTFGAVRIDFAAGTLTLGGPQGKPDDSGNTFTGPKGPPPSTVLTHGQTGTTIPLQVSTTPGDISLNVSVRFGRGRSYSFGVDTGSSQSVVNTPVATAVHLKSAQLDQQQSTVCSTITVPLDHTGPWSLPGLTLHKQLVGVTDFGPISSGGLNGLLGSDQLRRFGWMILDYRGGRLVLG
ncbi:MAG TPA: aspartyl protease family protein, partial [Acidimicrobiales bacterium]